MCQLSFRNSFKEQLQHSVNLALSRYRRVEALLIDILAGFGIEPNIALIKSRRYERRQRPLACPCNAFKGIKLVFVVDFNHSFISGSISSVTNAHVTTQWTTNPMIQLNTL